MQVNTKTLKWILPSSRKIEVRLLLNLGRKIRILKEVAAKSTDKNVKKAMAAFDAHLETFIGDEDLNKRDFDVPDMTEAVLTGKRMIDEISAQLGTR